MEEFIGCDAHKKFSVFVGCPRTVYPAAQRLRSIRVSAQKRSRELLRLRIFLMRLRTRVKNRIHGTLSHHNVQVPGADLFGVAALRTRICRPET